MLPIPVVTAMISSLLFISFRLCVGRRFLIIGLGSSKLGFGYIMLLSSISLFSISNGTCMYVWCICGCIMSEVSGALGGAFGISGFGGWFFVCRVGGGILFGMYNVSAVLALLFVLSPAVGTWVGAVGG